MIAANADLECCGLSCGHQLDVMAAQAHAHSVAFTACGVGGGTIVHTSDLSELIEASAPDVVLNALVGAAGLAPTIAAAERGITVALANKESLVVGGELVAEVCRRTVSRPRNHFACANGVPTLTENAPDAAPSTPDPHH